MKGLSFSQPWLWAMLDPIADKGIENRDWPPAIDMIDQDIALHAAKSFDDNGLHRLWELGIQTPAEYPKSCIVGVGTIGRIVTDVHTLTAAQQRWYMGPFRDGKTVYGWLIDNRRALPRPINWDGQLGLWTVPPIVESEIWSQLSGNPPDTGYKIPMLAALTAAGASSPAEWVAAHPGEHLYFLYPNNDRGIPSCVACGKVRPASRPAGKPGKPCPGIVRVTVRA